MPKRLGKVKSGKRYQASDIMKGMTVAIIGDAKMGSDLGKKGTATDVTFYNLKRGDVGITYVEPTRYPEKVQSLAFALGMADAVVITVEKKDKLLGETIVATDAFGITRGYFILQNYIQPDEIKPFIAGTALQDYQFIERDPNKINDMFVGYDLPYVDGPVKIPIDHFFNVKGVGTVVLGCVRRGTVKQHDELEVFPTGRKTVVRSIQVHDRDVTEAGYGNRVGLALKNIESTDFDRGFIMGPSNSIKVAKELEFKLNVSKFWKGTVQKDMVAHAAVGLQIKPVHFEAIKGGTIAPGNADEVKLAFDSPIAYDAGDRLVMLDLDSKGSRVLGYGTLA